MKIIVQFSDESKTKISGYLSCFQDEEVYPNQSEIIVSDLRWKEYFESLPAMLQQTLPTPN